MFLLSEDVFFLPVLPEILQGELHQRGERDSIHSSHFLLVCLDDVFPLFRRQVEQILKNRSAPHVRFVHPVRPPVAELLQNSPHQELVGGFAERRQDEDGVDGDRACFPRAIALSFHPAALPGKLVVLDQNDELSLLEAEERGVICGGEAAEGLEKAIAQLRRTTAAPSGA